MGVPLRVVARVRPPADNEEMWIHVVPSASQILIGNDDNFLDFDAVFSEETCQKELYSTCLEDIVNNSFHGLNATVVSYGQRGSGKTYTMTGPDFFPWAMNEEQFGVLPRAVRHIFKLMEDFPGREYRIQISYLIIHQESVYDLLSSGPTLTPLNVLEDNMGNVVIPGRTVITCSEIKDVFCCLFEGLAQKDSASKKGLDLTSSHSIFTLTLEHQWMEPDSRLNYVYSRLDFVDLAGWDESPYNCGSLPSPGVGHIIPDSDLKALRNIIDCLANKALGANQQMGTTKNLNDVPYKDSRLTHVLKEAFGGNSLTLMICCLSPSQKDVEASSTTSKLAYLARYIINYPTLNLIVQNSLQHSANTPNSPFNIHMLNSSRSSTQTGNQSSVGVSQRSMNGMIPIQPQPVSAFIPQQVKPVVHMPIPVPHAVNGICEEGNDMEGDEIFRVQFAASQWHLLVSSAEDLLAEILQSGSASPTEKSRIQSWLCMKAEADDCIGNDVVALHPTQASGRPLDVIEELSEPNEANDSLSRSSPSPDSESELSSDSSLDEEFYQQLDILKQKFFDVTTNLIRDTEAKWDTSEKLNCIKDRKSKLGCLHADGTPSLPCNIDHRSDNNANNPAAQDEKMSISVSTNDGTPEDSNGEHQKEAVNEKDKENLETKFGSKVTLLSGANQPFHSARKEMKYRLSSRKIRSKPKIKMGKGKSDLTSFELLSSSDSKGSFADSSSAKDKEMDSESELLRKVSSKLLSVSKGSSKCVDSLKSKSSQLKRSIKTHIFRKRNKNMPFSSEMVEKRRIPYSPESKPCPIRRLSVELKTSKDKLQELTATIKAKEALILELKLGGEEAETTHRKCQRKISSVEEELRHVDKCYLKAQSKLMEVDDDDEKDNYRRLVDGYHHQIKELTKTLAYLKKISSMSRSTEPSVAELASGIKDLREQQEELQTKLREDTQRKKQLEEQILRNERCSRKPLFLEESDIDEEENKENLFPPPAPHISLSLDKHKMESNPLSHSTTNQSLKRKLVNSTEDSQGRSCTCMSREGICRMHDRIKAGRLESRSIEDDGVGVAAATPTLEKDPNQVLTNEISQLRDAISDIAHKKQKLYRRIRKDRSGTVGFEEERLFVELDETIEGIDCVLEYKSGLLLGNGITLEAAASLLVKYDLIGILHNLSLDELRILLIKYFNRVVDLRIEFRKEELDYADLQNQYDEQNRYISSLKAAYQQASLQMERHLTSLHREYQYKISSLHRHFNKDNSGRSVDELKIFDLEKQLLYYKKRSREFKDKLREFYNISRANRYPDALPGPSGIKPRISGGALALQGDSDPPPNPLLFRRGRRSAIDEGGSQTEVIREKNKIIIQQKKDLKPATPGTMSHYR